jgi:predicted Zn-dependent protease
VNRRVFLACCGAPLLPRVERPDPASDEGGLWALMDREEDRLKRSPFLIRSAALNRYVSAIACRLAPEHCADVRVYLLRTPLFNAAMAPNGTLQVWSGLLLRMANEAQLAAMLAHEIGHYVARHSLERLRDAKSRSALGQLLSIVLSPAAFLGSALSAAAQMGLATGGLAYARDHEREADRIGLELMSRAGYDAAQAALVWQQLQEEGQGQAGLLFASHPPAEERSRTLASLALPGGRVDAQTYRAMLAPHRALFLEDELQRRRPGETLALLERLLRSAPGDGELHFFKGETFRRRGEQQDFQSALAEYRRAQASEGAPPQLYRSLGLSLRRLGRAQEASAAFARYLELQPCAVDAEMIRSYL